MLLNQTIVSDVAWLHLDFILCDDSLQLISNNPAPVFSKGCFSPSSLSNSRTDDPQAGPLDSHINIG